MKVGTVGHSCTNSLARRTATDETSCIIFWLDQSRGMDHARFGASKDSHLWDTYYYPVAQYSPNIALRDAGEVTLDQLDLAAFFSAGLPSRGAAQLPFFYNTSQPPDAKHSNPFSALHEVFQFAACSEVQFINLMDATIEHEM